MEAQTLSSRPAPSSRSSKKRFVPWISWGAIFGGLVSGMAAYILLALLGVAAGLTAVNPQAAEPIENVPTAALIWTGISMVLSAFVGGYVAARMSGLSRLADGIFHGLVAWGVSTLVFAYVITSSIGTLVGGAFGVFGQGMKAAAAAAGSAGAAKAQAALADLLKGETGGGEVSIDSLQALQWNLNDGDRAGAVDVMINRMGIAPDRASALADKGMALFSRAKQLPRQSRQPASNTMSGLAKASWGLFLGVLLSLALGVGGGAIGSRATIRRMYRH